MTEHRPSRPYRMLLVDDHPVFRAGLKKVLSALDEVEIIGEADDGEEALRMISSLEPDLVLLDLALPGLDGFIVLEQARKHHPDIRFAILTSYDDQAYIDRARELGADGFLLKDSAADDITGWLEHIRSGEQQHIRQLKAQAVLPPPLSNQLINRLTGTERLILSHVANSRTSREIAKELGISHRTVQNHRANICSKLGLHGPNQLLSFLRAHYGKM